LQLQNRGDSRIGSKLSQHFLPRKVDATLNGRFEITSSCVIFADHPLVDRRVINQQLRRSLASTIGSSSIESQLDVQHFDYSHLVADEQHFVD
jgi:hypothetical protein